MNVPMNHLLVSRKNPINLDESGSEVKVTGVKTLSFLAHFRLVRVNSQDPIAATAMTVPIEQPLVSI